MNSHGELSEVVRTRRSLLAGAAVPLAAGAVLVRSSTPAKADDHKESLLDKWIRTKKAVVGVDLTSPPMRFRDANGKATGLGIELLDMLLADIGTEAEYVEMPFGQTFAALAAGRFDMIGTFVTQLPSRALRGTFAGFPAHYQQNVAYLRPGLHVQSLSELNAAGTKIACQQGTSEEGMLKVTFPKAQIQAFPQMPDTFNALSSGRVDATVTDIQNVPTTLKTFPDVTVAPGTINVVPNTFFMQHDDFKLWAYLTNWLRYRASDRSIQGLEDKWYASAIRENYKLSTVTIGPGGEALVVNPS
jgi:polar amino acid transport system substrate-binding protein